MLVAAAAIPAHFVATDKAAVVAAGAGTTSPIDLSRVFLDGAKLSSAVLAAEAAAELDSVSPAIEAVYTEHPSWRVSGGDEPFFGAYLSTLSPEYSKIKNRKVYEILSLGENRKKLLEFLSESSSGIVKKFISLRSLNTTLLPPVFTSAGAPLDSALLSCALLAQSGDMSTGFLTDFSATFDKIENDPAEKEKLEKFCIGTLVLAKNFDWTSMRTLFSRFSSLDDAYDFGRLYAAAPSDDMRNAFAAGVLMIGGVPDCVRYLESADESKWRDFAFAYINGGGALKFLLLRDKPIYRDSAAMKMLALVCDPVRERLGSAAKDSPAGMLLAKLALALVGGYLAARGLIRLFRPRRDTSAWYSPLALVRGLLEGAVVALFLFLAVEPDAFKVKIENAPAPELKFAFDKVLNTIGEETMKFETDSATLAAVGLFLVLQFTVYVLCVIRLSAIKRTVAPAKLKLKLLENEENLFDLGLYIGLAGTVVSLILLTMGVVTASLMAAYASTLFGILFTAIVKIGHVRSYKRKLLIEADEEEA